MAKKTALVVTSPLGTFTRSTARTYTYLVVVKGYPAERLEASRLAQIAAAQGRLALYLRTVATGQCQDARPGTAGDWDRECTARHLADGSFQQWIAENRAEIARLTARGPITQDAEGWSLSDENLASTPAWDVAGWCGRFDLAAKLAATPTLQAYREVAIVDVATGAVVRRS
jgi:hypothetical protein